TAVKTYSFDDLTGYRRLHLVRGSASGGDSGTRLYRYLDMNRSKPGVVVPENSIQRDSPGERESAPHPNGILHGDRGAIGLSRTPMARKPCLKIGPYTESRSRIR